MEPDVKVLFKSLLHEKEFTNMCIPRSINDQKQKAYRNKFFNKLYSFVNESHQNESVIKFYFAKMYLSSNELFILILISFAKSKIL